MLLLQAPKRPVVQKEQDKGKGDEHGLCHQAQGKAEDEGEVARQSGPGNIGDIHAHGQHPEEGGKDILALGYPGDRFYVERVKGKKGCHKGAPPDCLCHPVKDEKEQ